MDVTGSHSSGRAADIIVETIEGQILSGILTDGAALPAERDLMSEYSVSRTVVREAIRILSQRGMIEARPRHRPVVRMPGFDTAFDSIGTIVTHLLGQQGGVKNLFETRILLEAGLARSAALSASKDDLTAMKAALDRNGAAIDDDDLFFQTDIAFHKCLFDVSGNPVLLAAHGAFTTWLSPHWSQMPASTERNAQNFAAHEALFEAILMRDADTAETALRGHLNEAWDQVHNTFEQESAA